MLDVEPRARLVARLRPACSEIEAVGSVVAGIVGEVVPENKDSPLVLALHSHLHDPSNPTVPHECVVHDLDALRVVLNEKESPFEEARLLYNQLVVGVDSLLVYVGRLSEVEEDFVGFEVALPDNDFALQPLHIQNGGSALEDSRPVVHLSQVLDRRVL